MGGGWRKSVNHRAVVVGFAIGIPLIGGLLYWQFGMPSANNLSGAVSLPSKGAADNDRGAAEGLEALSARLEAELKQHPGDGVGWALLARSYVEMGRHAEAVPRYEKAMKLIPDDPQVLADYADALGMLQGRKLEGKAEQLIRRALTLDPNNVKALRLAGTVAFDRKEFKQAARYWEKAKSNLAMETEGAVRQELIAAIAEAKALAGGGTAAGVLTGASMLAGVGSQSRAISGTVTVAPALSARAVSADTLFVFARQVNGSSMPVAIVRAAKRDLPFTFRLDDSNSPMPARKLSEAGDVVIVARLSKSGEAMPKSGDLEGLSRAVRMGAEKVTVVINRELP